MVLDVPGAEDVADDAEIGIELHPAGIGQIAFASLVASMEIPVLFRDEMVGFALMGAAAIVDVDEWAENLKRILRKL